MAQRPWTIETGEGPVLATAIHNGHEVRAEVAAWLQVPEEIRWREEDPLTGVWTGIGDSRVRVYRSRFEVDLNRPREEAVPYEAWGHQTWKQGVPEAVLEQSRSCHDEFYREIGELVSDLLERHPRLLVLDLHSYNHRRSGPEAPAADAACNPEVNIGTGTLTDPEHFERVVQRFQEVLRQHHFQGHRLDVRENVRFRGGYFPRWLHQTYPGAVCTLSIELKKTFMDEWTAQADIPSLETLRRALGDATAAARQALAAMD